MTFCVGLTDQISPDDSPRFNGNGCQMPLTNNHTTSLALNHLNEIGFYYLLEKRPICCHPGLNK